MILPLLIAGAAYLLHDATQGANRAIETVRAAPTYLVSGPLVSIIVIAYNEEKGI